MIDLIWNGSMTRTIALMCAKNEANRYLRESLAWNVPLVDDFFLFDDISRDATASIAEEAGVTVARRKPTDSSFTQNEGEFRQAAWTAMEDHMNPQEGDWIISIDADEFIVGDLSLDFLSGVAYRMKIHECFGMSDTGSLQIRVDGFWGEIWGVRVGRYVPDLKFAPTRLGGGSMPSEYMKAASTLPEESVSILHLGYMTEKDRKAKYDRYTLEGGKHASSHIRSIIEKPRLVDWDGPVPIT